MKRKTFEKGQIVYNQGDRSNSCYQIVNGSIELQRVTRNSSGAKQVTTVVSLKSGDVFGEMALIANAPRAASAVAAEPTVCVLYESEELLDLLESNPDDALDFVMSLIRRIRTANISVVEPTQGD